MLIFPNTNLPTDANDNIDPQLLRDTDCEVPVQANTSHWQLGARPQPEVTPDINEDGESKLKELREAANRSQSRTSVYYYSFTLASGLLSNKLGPFFTGHTTFDADSESDDEMESEDDGYMQMEGRGKEGDLKSSNAAAKLTRMFFYYYFPKES